MQALPYFVESGTNALLLEQKEIFKLQLLNLQHVVETTRQEAIEVKGDLKIPIIFSRRTLPDEYRDTDRYIDNEELTILAMLDSNGKLSCNARLTEFLVFMTRISKVIHRPTFKVCPKFAFK